MKQFDKEYSTQWVDEMKWLKTKGVNYSFVKTINGTTTYKYTKSSRLFELLAIFYSNKE